MQIPTCPTPEDASCQLLLHIYKSPAAEGHFAEQLGLQAVGTWYGEGFIRQFSTSALSNPVLGWVCLHGARWDKVEISGEVRLGLLLMPKEELSVLGVSSAHGCTVEDCMRRCREGVGVNGHATGLD